MTLTTSRALLDGAWERVRHEGALRRPRGLSGMPRRVLGYSLGWLGGLGVLVDKKSQLGATILPTT